MVRPTKFRKVEFFPEENYFIPCNKPKCKIKDIILKVEELEAMRLKDIENLNQEDCAKKMEVSRQTFQNIIDNARKKVALALTAGKAIRIQGGDYTTVLCKFKCLNCGTIYDINHKGDKYKCPHCGSEDIVCSKKADFCRRWCNNKK